VLLFVCVLWFRCLCARGCLCGCVRVSLCLCVCLGVRVCVRLRVPELVLVPVRVRVRGRVRVRVCVPARGGRVLLRLCSGWGCTCTCICFGLGAVVPSPAPVWRGRPVVLLFCVWSAVLLSRSCSGGTAPGPPPWGGGWAAGGWGGAALRCLSACLPLLLPSGWLARARSPLPPPPWGGPPLPLVCCPGVPSPVFPAYPPPALSAARFFVILPGRASGVAVFSLGLVRPLAFWLGRHTCNYSSAVGCTSPYRSLFLIIKRCFLKF
jgi:hypothetical protein